MWINDAVAAGDPHLLWLCDRLDLLLEVEALVMTIAAIQQQDGGDGELKDLSRRVQRVRAIVLEQVRALFDQRETVH
jgi:hypothetical protein